MGFEEIIAGAGYWGILLMVPFATMFMWARSKQADAITDAEVGRGVLKLATTAIDRNRTLEDDRLKLATEVADLTRRVINLELDLSYAQRDNRAQAEKIAVLSEEVEALKNKLTSEHGRADRAELENSLLRGRITELEAQVKELEGRIAGLLREREQELQRNIALITEMEAGEGEDKDHV